MAEKHRASEHCWRQRFCDTKARAAEEQTIAAYEWAMERDARLAAKDHSDKQVVELKNELNEEILHNRTSAVRSDSSKLELQTKLQLVAEERDSLRIQLSEL